MQKNRPVLAVAGFSLLLMYIPLMRIGEFKVPLFWDDISIVFVYAINLVATGEIFYNVPADRLDGFTSMADVLLVAPLALIDPDNMFRLNYYLKAILTALVPVAVFYSLMKREVPALVAGAVALAVAGSETLAHGFGMQLEAPLYALLIITFFIVLTGQGAWRGPLLAIVAFVLFLTRPEAAALVLAALFLFVVLLRDDERLRETLIAGAGFIALLASWIIWRISYFGYWAPNTYYAKMSGSRLSEIMDGLGFVGSYLTRAPEALLLPAMLIMVAVLLLPGLRSGQDKRIYYFGVFAGVAICMLCVRIATGGDSYWMSSRLLIDTMIPVALAAGMGLSVVSHKPVRNLALAGLVLSIAANGFMIVRDLPGNLWGFVRMEQKAYRGHNCERQAFGEFVAQHPDAVLAHTDFQRAKYYAPQLEVVDLSGLNNREIAHDETGYVHSFGKHNLVYGLERKADILKIGTGVREFEPLTEAQWLAAMNPANEPVRDLYYAQDFLVANEKELARDYTPLPLTTNCGDYINVIVRRDLTSDTKRDNP